MCEIKSCSECKHFPKCDFDTMKNRYYDLRDGKQDCFESKE